MFVILCTTLNVIKRNNATNGIFLFETRPFSPKELGENIESEVDAYELHSSMQDDGTLKHVARANYSKKICS